MIFLRKELNMVKQFGDFFSGLFEIISKRKEKTKTGEDSFFEIKNIGSVFDSMKDGVCIINDKMEIEYANIALQENFGFIREEKTKCYKYFHGKNAPCVGCRNNEVLCGEISNWEQFYPKINKSFDISLAPLKGKNGKVNAKVEIYKDVTKYKKICGKVDKLNKKLEKHTSDLEFANKELEAFAYTASHDLKAPLRSMGGFSRAILEDYSAVLDEKGRDYLWRINNSSEQMAKLVDNLLNLSRSSVREVRLEKVNLSKIAEDFSKELKKSSPERRVCFKITSNLNVFADAELVESVVKNLFRNAWKFTSKNDLSVIEFGFKQGKDGKKIYFVKDNGVGFDAVFAEKIFSPFQRLHSMADFPGMGIGLATVKRIIDHHGGKIWAKSEIGKGAIFYFFL